MSPHNFGYSSGFGWSSHECRGQLHRASVKLTKLLDWRVWLRAHLGEPDSPAPPLSPGDTLHPVIRKNCCIYEHHQIQTRHDLLISDVYNAYAPTISDRMITIWLSLYAKAALQCINRFCPQVCQKGLATRKRIKSIQVSIGIYYNSNMRPG